MSSSSSSTDPSSRVPLLGGNTPGCTAYPQWRPLVQAYFTRAGIEEADYAREIPRWAQMVSVVQADTERENEAAEALLFGSSQKTVNDAASSSMKEEDASRMGVASAEALQRAAAKKNVAARVARSRKAFGILYAALPAELRLLVAEVQQGYAYGIWSLLEKKYRNTAQDSVAALWADLSTLLQESEEDFGTYKARVDSSVELLKHAKQNVQSGHYTSILLWRLQPRYATAVLTLKTGDKITDTDKIDWTSIVDYMSQYERAQTGLGEADGPGANADRVLAARGRAYSQQQKSSTGLSAQQQQSRSTAECWDCHGKGHYRNSPECPMQSSSRKPPYRGGDEKHPANRDRELRLQSEDEDEADETDRPSKRRSERANMMRSPSWEGSGAVNRGRYEAEEYDESDSFGIARSYGAIAAATRTKAEQLDGSEGEMPEGRQRMGGRLRSPCPKQAAKFNAADADDKAVGSVSGANKAAAEAAGSKNKTIGATGAKTPALGAAVVKVRSVVRSRSSRRRSEWSDSDGFEEDSVWSTSDASEEDIDGRGGASNQDELAAPASHAISERKTRVSQL